MHKSETKRNEEIHQVERRACTCEPYWYQQAVMYCSICMEEDITVNEDDD